MSSDHALMGISTGSFTRMRRIRRLRNLILILISKKMCRYRIIRREEETWWKVLFRKEKRHILEEYFIVYNVNPVHYLTVSVL